ncbi:MAG: hypothetical protein ACT4O1_15515 [Gemmatimonadota bacterium]
MDTQTIPQGKPEGRPQDTLNVSVRYAAAQQPFQDHDASRTETLVSLKARVLQQFGLTEGQGTPEGNVINYKLYHEKTELIDLSRSLGDVAGNAHALVLKLSQFIQQGGSCTR